MKLLWVLLCSFTLLLSEGIGLKLIDYSEKIETFNVEPIVQTAERIVYVDKKVKE